MKDKEMIEEMAKVIIEASCQGKECENCAFIKSVAEAEECCVCLKALYNAGYRKLSEDSVVLTREEYENIYEQAEANVLANIADGGTSCHWCIEQHEKKASKETAEKIIYIIKTFSYDKEFTKIITRIISERFSVEIKEYKND